MSRPVRLALSGLAALGLTLGLSGCIAHVRTVATPPRATAPAAPPPAAETRIVRVPTPLKCVPDTLGPPPSYPDSDTALREAGGAADRYQLLAAGRILRDQRLQKLEDVVRRCRNAAR